MRAASQKSICKCLIRVPLDLNLIVHIDIYIDYRRRATTGRYQLVAAPLRLQAKSDFLFHFYVTI